MCDASHRVGSLTPQAFGARDDNRFCRGYCRRMLTVLFLGDVVGEPGRTAVIARMPELKKKYALDFVIVNGENAAGGR